MTRLFRMTLPWLWMAALLVAAGCGDPAPLPIGFAGPLEGKYSDLGVHGRNGARLAVEHLNAGGGVAGQPLELLVEDDVGTAEGAVLADRALARAGALAVIGHMTSFQSLAAIPVAKELGLVLVSPTTSTPAAAGIRDHFFRVMPSSDAWAEALAEHAGRTLDIGSAAIVYDEDNLVYSRPFVQSFSSRFERDGGQVLDTAGFSSAGSPDWRGLLDRLLAHDPDALVLVASVRDSASILRTLRVARKDLPVLMAPWGFSQDLLVSAGRAAEGVISALAYTDDNPAPSFTAFQQEYAQRFGAKPSFAAAFAYEAVLVLARALEQTGGERAGLEEALAGMDDVTGISGTFRIDEFGDVDRPYFVLAVRGGRLISISEAGGQ